MFASSSNLVSTLCHNVKQAYVHQDARTYAQSLDVDLNNPTVQSLISELVQVS